MELIGDLERAFAASIYPNRVLLAVFGAGALVALVFLARRRRWDRAVRRRPRTALVGAAVTLAIGLPLAWYLGSPLLLSTTIDEPAPVAAAPSIEPTATPPTDSARPSPTVAAQATPEATRPPSPTPAPPIEREGTFQGADDFHFGEGTARLIETAPGSFTVRLEAFAVRNGPDLYVYLSPDAGGQVDDAIELGRLKADRGNQNYEVPAGSDVSRAASVVIWCKQFSVLFATAPLR